MDEIESDIRSASSRIKTKWKTETQRTLLATKTSFTLSITFKPWFKCLHVLSKPQMSLTVMYPRYAKSISIVAFAPSLGFVGAASANRAKPNILITKVKAKVHFPQLPLSLPMQYTNKKFMQIAKDVQEIIPSQYMETNEAEILFI